MSTIASRYQPNGEHLPLRSDKPQTGTTSEPFSVNDPAGTNALVGIPGAYRVLYLLTSKQSTGADFERTREEPLLEDRGLDQKSKELGLEPQLLTRSTSARADNSFAHGRGGDYNQSIGTSESLRQKAGYIPPVGAESLHRGLTRSPSPVSSRATPYIGSTGPLQENLRTAKPRGWIRRLSMPVLSSLDSSKKTDSPSHNYSPQTWRSSLALPETKSRYRKTSLDIVGSESNQRRQ